MSENNNYLIMISVTEREFEWLINGKYHKLKV